MAGEAPEQLSERELELLARVSTGATNQQIARDLSISVNTVKAHLRNIFAKLGVESRTEATLLAIQQGLIHVATPAGANADAPSPPASPEPIPIAWPLRPAQSLVLLAALALIVATAVWPSAQAGVTGVDSRFIDLPRPEAVAREEAEASRWRSGAQMPVAAGRLAQAVVDRTIYAIGGLTDEGWSASTDAYDPEEDRWVRGAAKPTAVANAAAAAVDGLIYVPGGLDGSGTVRDLLEVYDPRADAWTERARIPAPRCSYAIAPVEGGFVLVGGWDGQGYVGTVYRYEAAADAWEELAPMQIPRGHAAAVTWNGRVYVLGGYDGTTEYGLCESFDPLLARDGGSAWRTHMPMSVARADHAATVAEGILYVVGGNGDGPDAYNERYDIANDVWSSFDSPVTGRWQNLGLSAVTTRGGSFLYAMGGWGDEYLSAVHIYQISFRLFLP